MKFFRKDYKYIEDAQAFYKIHTIHRTWEDAKETCSKEGALLFYPNDDDEANIVLNFWNNTQPFSWVFIGISTPNVKQVFETVDGELSNIILLLLYLAIDNNNETNEYSSFLCKNTKTFAFWRRFS